MVHLSQSNLLEQSIESHLQLHSHPLVLQNTCMKNKNYHINFNLFFKNNYESNKIQ